MKVFDFYVTKYAFGLEQTLYETSLSGELPLTKYNSICVKHF